MPKAVSLHHHTTYSFLDGHGTPEQHLQRAAELGYSALAFTEHGNTSSHFRAEKAANKIGSVKPIFGIEAYTASSYGDPQQTKYHLTMLAMNQRGYRNLNLAVTRSYKQHHYHPTMTGMDVAEFNEGATVLSGLFEQLRGVYADRRQEILRARDAQGESCSIRKRWLYR